MRNNGFKINEKKTVLIVFRSTHSKQKIKENHYILINGVKIYPKDKLSYLGIVIQENMLWKEHISSLVTNIRSLMPAMYRIRTLLPVKIRKLVFHSMITSRVYYCIEAWGAVKKTNLHVLQRTVNKVIRIMLKEKKDVSAEILYNALNWNNVLAIYVTKMIHLGWGVLTGRKLLDIELELQNEASIESINLRSRTLNLLKEHYAANRYGEATCEARISKIWNFLERNAIANDIFRGFMKLNTFPKGKLKKTLLEVQFGKLTELL